MLWLMGGLNPSHQWGYNPLSEGAKRIHKIFFFNVLRTKIIRQFLGNYRTFNTSYHVVF